MLVIGGDNISGCVVAVIIGAGYYCCFIILYFTISKSPLYIRRFTTKISNATFAVSFPEIFDH